MHNNNSHGNNMEHSRIIRNQSLYTPTIIEMFFNFLNLYDPNPNPQQVECSIQPLFSAKNARPL